MAESNMNREIPPPSQTTNTASTPKIVESTINSTRKATKPRSRAWDHFTPFKDFDGKQKSKCNYCGKVYATNSKKNGTSNLLNHMDSCIHHPCSEDLRQTQLNLHAKRGGDHENIGGSLSTWKFDQEFCRKKLTSMIIRDELPFKFVEGEGFVDFVNALQPRFKIPSRWTVSRDCYQLYLDEKKNLRELFQKSRQRVCITTDTWTSLQQINYMCITAHFIDNDWTLHKKIINFCTVESHRGEELAKQLDNCLREWGIARVLAITVDNASSNDTCINFLRGRLTSRGCAVAKGKYLHMRCVAHILNLIVGDGLKEINSTIKKVRDAIRFVRHSPLRLRRFKECCIAENIDCKSLLCLDVPTRWNSTYLMLNVALKFVKAFERFEIEDPYFSIDLPDGVPTSLDWENAKNMVEILGHFYDLTVKISGSLYVTSNLFYHDLLGVKNLLKVLMVGDDIGIRLMAIKMREKYDKYWGDPLKMNQLLYVAAVLDPRYKFGFIKYALVVEFGEKVGLPIVQSVLDALKELFEAYKVIRHPPTEVLIQEQQDQVDLSNQTLKVDNTKKMVSVAAQYKRLKKESGDGNQSELDVYLEEKDIADTSDFNILKWWKDHQCRFPILSCLAKDILSMPISTVASESAFSTGGRVLDAYRSSLTPKIVESLICSQDWTRSSNKPISIEEDLESLAKHEEVIKNIGTSTSGSGSGTGNVDNA